MTVLTYTNSRSTYLVSNRSENRKLSWRRPKTIQLANFILGGILIILAILYVKEAAFYISVSDRTLALTSQNQALIRLNNQLNLQASGLANLDFLQQKAKEFGLGQIKQGYLDQINQWAWAK